MRHDAQPLCMRVIPQMGRRRAFTLIELLVVVVVIGLLASIALPSFVGAYDKARNAGQVANVNTIRMALEQFGADHDGRFPLPSELMSTSNGVGIRANLYLPNNRWPKPPWSAVSQNASISFQSPLVVASNLVTGATAPDDGQRLGTMYAGSIPVGAPTHSLQFGAIAYDYDSNAEVYVLYGTGKRVRDAIKVAHMTNNQAE